MVKFKSRYILVELCYSNDKEIQSLDSQTVANCLKDEVTKYFGVNGLGKINKNLQVKYVNSFTNLMIIRIGREYLNMIWTVLALLTNISGNTVRMKIVTVKGSIKKCEIKATELLKEWMINYKSGLNIEKVGKT